MSSLAKLDLTYLDPIDSARKTKLELGSENDAKAKEVERLQDGGQYTESAAKQAKLRDTAFDQLVLPEGHKEMVMSLIAQHFRDKDSLSAEKEQVDIVRGKGRKLRDCFCFSHSNRDTGPNIMLGKGLIILLHGLPGVGKTTTAGQCDLHSSMSYYLTNCYTEGVAQKFQKPLFQITCGKYFLRGFLTGLDAKASQQVTLAQPPERSKLLSRNTLH